MKAARRLAAGLADGGWVTPRRLRDYSLMLLAGYAIAVIALVLTAEGIVDRFGRPLGTDFMQFWAASKLVLAGRAAAVYDVAALTAEQFAAMGRETPGFHIFPYPPLALLLFWPLAALPYLPALGLWLAGTGAAYLAVLWRIAPSRQALLAGAAFPAVFIAVMHGHNSFLVTALMGGALLCLDRRPLLAGMLFGAIAFKPQLGLLVPVALAAGGHWRAFVAAGLTTAGLAAASLLAFGTEPWAGWRLIAEANRVAVESGLLERYKLQSIYGGIALLGGGQALAYAVQAAVSLAAALAVAAAWRGTAAMPLKGAVLVAATLVATPYLLDYDFLLLALPMAWLAKAGLRGGFLPWERSALVMAFALPLVARPLAAIGLPLASVALPLFLWACLRRARARA